MTVAKIPKVDYEALKSLKKKKEAIIKNGLKVNK